MNKQMKRMIVVAALLLGVLAVSPARATVVPQITDEFNSGPFGGSGEWTATYGYPTLFSTSGGVLEYSQTAGSGQYIVQATTKDSVFGLANPLYPVTLDIRVLSDSLLYEEVRFLMSNNQSGSAYRYVEFSATVGGPYNYGYLYYGDSAGSHNLGFGDGWFPTAVGTYRLELDNTGVSIRYSSSTTAAFNALPVLNTLPFGGAWNWADWTDAQGAYGNIFVGGNDSVSGTITFDNFQLTGVIPEPSTMMLLALGGLLVWRKRRS